MVLDKCDGDGVDALHVACDGGMAEWETETIRKWAFEGMRITSKLLSERRASLAQAQVTMMKAQMPRPPKTPKAWRDQFVAAVVGGNTKKAKQLVVAIMLLADDELVSTAPVYRILGIKAARALMCVVESCAVYICVCVCVCVYVCVTFDEC